MIGTLLSHYRIVERIGAGGMGVVYHAVDERLQRDVAIKVLPEGALQDDEARRRFRLEAQAASRVTHPHIGTVFDFDSADGTDFLVMEWVRGETLDRVIARGPLPEAEVLALGAQLADALEALHELGVLHCDLKPGNVMVGSRGQAKLLDFGLARLVREHDGATRTSTPTRSNPIAGTLPYLSPEQVAGRPVDGRADLYALGVVLYETATGRRPFTASDPATLFAAILQHDPAPPHSLRPELSPAFEALVLRALEKWPERRFDSAHAFREALEATRAGTAPAPATAAAGTVSLAVLPLASHTSDPEHELFADAMTETLISGLAQIGALRVISRTSVMAYRGSDRPLPEIASRLGVSYVLEGSVMRAGERVRITAQLVEAASDRPVWSRSYERPMDDVLALQAEVSSAIADEVRVHLTPNERTRLGARRAVPAAAYDAYVRGRHHWNQRSPGSLARAIDEFRRAIDLAPEHALAWTGLADCHNILGVFRWREPGPTFERAKAAAMRALEIDPELAEGHASLAFALEYHDWDWAAARAGFERALQLQPGYAGGRQWYSEFLIAMGEFEPGIEEARRAWRQDPLAAVVGNSLGDAFYFARRFGESIIEYRRVLELDPHFLVARLNLARALQHLGRHDEAIAGFAQAFTDTGTSPDTAPAMAYAYAAAGRRADAERVLARVLDPAPGRPIANYSIATVYAGLGDRDRAFEWLERAFAERDIMMVHMEVHPRLDPLRDDARFGDLLRRMAFP